MVNFRTSSSKKIHFCDILLSPGPALNAILSFFLRKEHHHITL